MVKPEQVGAESNSMPLPHDPRQCGRCRKFFPGDPALDAAPVAKWWLCEPCRATFFSAPASASLRHAR